MKNSVIQWTDHTFNPWEGCTKVAQECKNCYAEALVDHRFGRAKWGKGQPRRRTSENLWKQPLAWNKTAICLYCGYAELIGSDDCRGCGINFAEENRRRPRVFCLSLGDWLDEEVPIEWLADLLDLIRRCENLDWQLLTKRSQNFVRRLAAVCNWRQATGEGGQPSELFYWIEKWLHGESPSNVWIGVSAGADLKAALDIPAKIHFLSCEPMLHALDTKHAAAGFDWIIFGGESGKNARRTDVDWIEEGITFCRVNGIAPFVKQLGAQPHIADASHSHGWDGQNVEWDKTGRIYLRDSHGGDMSEWPEDLRIRQFPNA